METLLVSFAFIFPILLVCICTGIEDAIKRNKRRKSALEKVRGMRKLREAQEGK